MAAKKSILRCVPLIVVGNKGSILVVNKLKCMHLADIIHKSTFVEKSNALIDCDKFSVENL